MLMLYNSGELHISFSVVYHCISLIIVGIKSFILKVYSSILQHSKLIIKELINHSGIYSFISYIRIFLYEISVLGICSYFYTLKKLFNYSGISSNRNTLVSVIEIIIVKCKSKRQSLYNKCRKFLGISAPLLFRISLYKLFIYILAHQRYSLFFQILRICDT